MAEQNYTYAVARIRSKELALINQAVLEQLLASKSYEECLRLLYDKGWGKSGEETSEELLRVEREKTWELIRELVKDVSVFNTFLYTHDFHNLKAAIKEVYLGQEHTLHIYMEKGTIEPQSIFEAIREHDFNRLPEFMRACAQEAFELQVRTGDSQLCDVIIDRAALEAIKKVGQSSGNELFSHYAELKVAAANIQIALRSYKTGKDKAFLKRALAACETLDVDKLIAVVGEGEEALYNYLETTPYRSVVEAIKHSSSALEKWCDNLIMKDIQNQKYNPFTIAPLAAYILARENEIKAVRMILSGKLNNLPDQWIRERMREMYV